MMKAHNVRIEIFCKEDETEGVREWLEDILPKDTPIEKEVLGPELEGEVFKEPLVVFRVKLERAKEVDEFLRMMRESLSVDDIEKLKMEVGNRVDEGCNFYVRLRKGGFVLQSDDAVHVKIKVAVYPARREQAVEEVRGWLE